MKAAKTSTLARPSARGPGVNIGKAFLALLVVDVAYVLIVSIPISVFLDIRSAGSFTGFLAKTQIDIWWIVGQFLIYPVLSVLIILSGMIAQLLAGRRLRLRGLALLMFAVCGVLALVQSLFFLVVFSLGPTFRIRGIIVAVQVIPFTFLWLATYLWLLRPKKFDAGAILATD